MMKKSELRMPIIVVTLLVVYSVIVFALPLSMNAIFRLSYLASIFAIGIQLYIVKTAFVDAKSVKSKFYGFPIMRIGVIYLVAQLIASLVFMVASTVIPMWVVVIVYVVLIAFVLIGTISAEAMREEIQRQDEVLKANVSTMRSIQSQANSLIGLCKDDALQKKVKAFAEELRYSDPVSSDSTQTIEDDLQSYTTELQAAILEQDTPSSIILLEKVITILTERNRLCKLGKK